METKILYSDNGTTTTTMGETFNRTYNASEDHVQLINMLHPSYDYAVRIAAATSAGVGPFGRPLTVTMPEDGESFNCCICNYSMC